jgi:mRNA-degrading endonuclease RelE of RelBE toxin-antitoxin system
MYKLIITNKAKKQYLSLDDSLRKSFELFFIDIVQNPFVNKLYDNVYHAHIKYKWVSVWQVDKEEKIILVTYIGSRENAPY